MCTEDLNKGDLQGRDLAVHEDTRQVKLDLETDIDIGSVDSRTPPQGNPDAFSQNSPSQVGK